MFARLGREFAGGVRDLLYPAVCMACGRPLPEGVEPFCRPCSDAITTDPHRTCPRCTSSVGEFAHLDGGCPRCRGETYHYDEAFRLGPYDGPLRELILRVKFGRDEALGEALGRLWARHAEARFRAVGAQAVVPVPLHWWRRWRRGFNQARPLADAVAGRLCIPCRAGAIRRARPTVPQTEQAPSARRDNVRGAFRTAARTDVRGLTVLLVDDVLTTGSTASEAARALKQAGAARVAVAVLAHR